MNREPHHPASSANTPVRNLPDLATAARAELTTNILPFWQQHFFTADNFIVGAVQNDGHIRSDDPRHAVLVARTLWTFAATIRTQANPAANPEYFHTAKQVRALLEYWRDLEHGGVFWSLDPAGAPLSDRKQVYAQAFTIYGLAEWYRASNDTLALQWALEIFALLEEHSRDYRHGGYLEAHSRTWGELADTRLSDKDLSVPKSMNTNLHVLEAYTTLLRATDREDVAESLQSLLAVSLNKIVSYEPWAHCQLFFDHEWNSVIPDISYGHDIEASWLLWDALTALQEHARTTGHEVPTDLATETERATLALADAVIAHGVAPDGGVMYEGTADEITIPERHWWPQAEGVVGWLNAYQISGAEKYLRQALDTWNYLASHVIDNARGEWFAVVDPTGKPVQPADKIGPWKCPYHNGRACMEVFTRVDALDRLGGNF